jgi:hypothetical protein
MFDPSFRLLCNLAGVDHERLRGYPLGDRQFAVRIGLQLLFSSTFLFAIFASSLLIGFGDDTASDCVVLAMAFITAAVVLLVDIQIVQSDFHQHGLELARDRGHEDGNNRLWAKIKRPATVSLRLLLSVTIAFAFATFFELRLFGSDIMRQIDVDYRKANAALFHDVGTGYAAGLDLMTGEMSRQTAELTALGEQETALRRRLLENPEADREIDVLTEELNQLSAAKKAADAEVLRRQGDAVNEKNGIKESADHSGLKGEGSLYRNATERARLAALESARLLDEMTRAQSTLGEMRDKRERRTERTSAFVAAELQKLDEAMTAVRSRRDELGAKHERAINDREARVIAIAQERPEYSAKADGFLARVEALETLKDRPAVARVTFWTTLVIMAVEVSAVLGKVFFSTPTLYAVRTALEFENAVKELLRRNDASRKHTEAASIRRDIEIEEMRQVLVEKRVTRRTKEEAMQRLYPEKNDRAA